MSTATDDSPSLRERGARKAKAAKEEIVVRGKTWAPDRDLATDSRGQTNMVGLFIGIMIASIVAVDVMIPVILNSVSNLTGASDNTVRILELIPLFAGLLLLVGMAGPLMKRI